MKNVAFLLAGLLALGVFVYPLNQAAFAHTFSSSESAQFLSMVEQVRAEAALSVVNLQNNNVTLAQIHASKAAALLDNATIDEIRERNERIAETLTTTLAQLESNITSLPAQGQVSQDALQQANQTVSALNDILGETTAVRIEGEQTTNATTWASVLADLANVVLHEYGNATGAPFDLTDMSNLSTNQTGSMMNDAVPMSNNTMAVNGTTIVDMSAYQSAQYLANNTMLELFNNTLMPLTTDDNATNIDTLEANLMQLRDRIQIQASPNDVMAAVHLGIHPILIQLYGLIVAPEEEAHQGASH
jgi:hypothetical protein